MIGKKSWKRAMIVSLALVLPNFFMTTITPFNTELGSSEIAYGSRVISHGQPNGYTILREC